MVDATFFEALIAYTAVLLTISTSVIGFLLYQFVPLKINIATMKVDIENIKEAVEETRKRQTSLIKMYDDRDDIVEHNPDKYDK